MERDNRDAKPNLDSLVNSAVEKLKNHQTNPNGEPFASYAAAHAAIKETNVSGYELFGLVINETRLKPSEVNLSDLDTDEDTWESVFEEITERIVASRIQKDYKEIEEEAYNRLEQWDEATRQTRK